MAVKIRLARKGRKKQACYNIVVATSTSPRDGRFIEKIGNYDPLQKTCDIDIDKAVDWMFKGAQPTNTANRLLSNKGVLLKKHLQVGVRKGAITQDVADSKWKAWFDSKAQTSTVK